MIKFDSGFVMRNEPLPGVLGSRGAWAYIFRDIGRSSNYFQGLREPGFRFWGSREIKGTLIFRFFCSEIAVSVFIKIISMRGNLRHSPGVTRAIRSLCVMQCIMGKLKHMARHSGHSHHSQDGGREC